MGNSFVEAEYKDPGYAEAKRRSKEINTNAYDAEIAAGMNKSAQAGAVQGVGNPGGLAADTYAEMSDKKAQRASAIEDEYNNYELQHKAGFYDEQARAKQQFEMNKPGFLNWLGFGVNTLGSIASIPVGNTSLLGSILKIGTKSPKKATTTNYGGLQSTFLTPPKAGATTDNTQTGLELPNQNQFDIGKINPMTGKPYGSSSFNMQNPFNMNKDRYGVESKDMNIFKFK